MVIWSLAQAQIRHNPAGMASAIRGKPERIVAASRRSPINPNGQPSGAVMKLYQKSLWISGAAFIGLAFNLGYADPPPDIESALVKIGPIVDPVCTARLYRPLMPKQDITSNLPQTVSGSHGNAQSILRSGPKRRRRHLFRQDGCEKSHGAGVRPGGAGQQDRDSG